MDGALPAEPVLADVVTGTLEMFAVDLVAGAGFEPAAFRL
jgi:hypothetical protein